MFSLIHGVVTDLQAKQLDTMKEKELILSGDGQCDSSGKNANFVHTLFGPGVRNDSTLRLWIKER